MRAFPFILVFSKRSFFFLNIFLSNLYFCLEHFLNLNQCFLFLFFGVFVTILALPFIYVLTDRLIHILNMVLPKKKSFNFVILLVKLSSSLLIYILLHLLHLRSLLFYLLLFYHFILVYHLLSFLLFHFRL